MIGCTSALTRYAAEPDFHILNRRCLLLLTCDDLTLDPVVSGLWNDLSRYEIGLRTVRPPGNNLVRHHRSYARQRIEIIGTGTVDIY